MKRTRNGILIPDVPIMAGGNLPNAVKGVSSGKVEVDYYKIPFFIYVHTSLRINGDNGLLISDDAKNWQTFGEINLNKGTYYFLSNANRILKPNIVIEEGRYYDIGGNINSLFGAHYKNDSVGRDYTELFQRQNIVDASRLAMPQGDSGFCARMLQYCLKLRKAPALPAMTLYPDAYFCMMQGCVSLELAPDLPAITLTRKCYDGLFNGCVSLSNAPILPAAELKPYCYEGMFYDCSLIRRIECHAFDISAESALNSWTGGRISNVGTFVKKRGVEWPTGESGIPSGWTVEEID